MYSTRIIPVKNRTIPLKRAFSLSVSFLAADSIGLFTNRLIMDKITTSVRTMEFFHIISHLTPIKAKAINSAEHTRHNVADLK